VLPDSDFDHMAIRVKAAEEALPVGDLADGVKDRGLRADALENGMELKNRVMPRI